MRNLVFDAVVIFLSAYLVIFLVRAEIWGKQRVDCLIGIERACFDIKLEWGIKP